jgi:hypothetical protein
VDGVETVPAVHRDMPPESRSYRNHFLRPDVRARTAIDDMQQNNPPLPVLGERVG